MKIARWQAGLAALISLVALMATPAGATVSATDFTGQVITLQQPATRIVALAPHLVENLFSAGAGDAVVGAVEYSDYPKAAEKIPRIGGYHSMSLEKIVALHPDLVVAWGSGGTADLVKQLKTLQVPVYIDVPEHMADIGKIIRDLGHLTGHDQTAQAAAGDFEHHVARLKARYAKRSPVSLFYVVSNDPLQTLSNRGLIGDVLTLCGGRNIFANEPALAPRVSIESVLSRNPQAIVAGDDNPHAWRTYWQQWPALQAVHHNHLLSIPADLISRPSIRIAQGAAELCRKLDDVRDSQ